MLARPTAIPQLSFYFNNFCWNQPLTAGVLLGHLAMTDRDAFQRLDHVMWSLVQETRISFLFPFIFIWAKARWLATTALSVVVSGSALTAFHFLRWDPLFDPLFTLSYLFLFAVGAVVALRATRLAGLFNGLPRVARLGLWLLTLGIVTYYPANRHYGLFVCGTAALMLVFLCHADLRARRWLSIPFAVWLGRISFSLYLVHMPILFTLLHVCWGRLPVLVLLLAVLSSSLAAAELMCRCIARPSIALGRRLSAPRRAQLGARVTTQQP